MSERLDILALAWSGPLVFCSANYAINRNGKPAGVNRRPHLSSSGWVPVWSRLILLSSLLFGSRLGSKLSEWCAFGRLRSCGASSRHITFLRYCHVR
jgi:hypothetical protein